MSTPVVYNGVTYHVPSFGDIGYAQSAGNMSAYWIALATGSLQQTGGAFTLTADVNFGPTFGILSKYFASVTPNPATAGVVRVAKTDTLDWRNNANTGNLALGIDGSDNLTFNGIPLTGSSVASITGTANEIIVSSPTGAVVLSTPQPIAPASSPTFNSLTLTNPLAIADGGSGTTSPSLVAGSNISITGSWPNQTVSASGSIAVPSGAITMYGGSSAPSGWILCDGSSYTTAGQPALFAAIGYNYGGAGANFNVPNFPNFTPIGAGSIAALGATAGSQTHTLVDAEMAATGLTVNVTDPGHFHQIRGNTVNSNDNAITTSGTGAISLDAGATHPGTDAYVTASTTGHNWINNATTGITANGHVNGSATPFSIVQPVLGVTFIIKT